MFGAIGYTPNSNTQTHTKEGRDEGEISVLFLHIDISAGIRMEGGGRMEKGRKGRSVDL